MRGKKDENENTTLHYAALHYNNLHYFTIRVKAIGFQ